MKKSAWVSLVPVLALLVVSGSTRAWPFEGNYVSGEGDEEYLQLLDMSYRMLYPDPELQNISMLYTPVWNGFVEGPTWGAWWIQNSYGPTYCGLPFFVEPYATFIQNSQDLWFNLMGDGKRKGMKDWVAPDGCLCDAAAPNLIYYKQGDGRIDIHDWGMEFTAAGVVMQSELLLINRDLEKIRYYLPMLERSANFIETRRDPANNLFLAGPAGNLLAPSYAGWRQEDGSYKPAYLTGLSITYIAALDRLIELEKMAGNGEKTTLYSERRDLAKQGLALLTTEEGYFIKYMDPDGTKHGVYGAEKHGYFEAVCNHDAIAFRVADEEQSRKIYNKMASLPGLRPHGVIITNYPGLDDMYTDDKDWLWSFGTWVNGGHWTTCEARAIMAYYRLGQHEDARRSMKHILEFAKAFRTDNPLVEFGAKPYQPKEPINCVYDTWGAPTAMIRGLFEYLYNAEGLILIPHIPGGITRLEQRFPVRLGAKKIYVSTVGTGPVTAVKMNGADWASFDATAVTLSYDRVPETGFLQIALGGASLDAFQEKNNDPITRYPGSNDSLWNIEPFIASFTVQAPAGCRGTDEEKAGALTPNVPFSKIGAFYNKLAEAGLGESYEAQHAKLICTYMNAIQARIKMKSEGTLPLLPEVSQCAADRSYVESAVKLVEGLSNTIASYEGSDNPHKNHVFELWTETKN